MMEVLAEAMPVVCESVTSIIVLFLELSIFRMLFSSELIEEQVQRWD